MSILSMVEVAFYLVKFVRSFFKIKLSDLLTIGKKSQDQQEPNLSATKTNYQEIKELKEEVRQFKEEVTQLKKLVYLLLPQDKKNLIQIEAESKTIPPALKYPKLKRSEVKDLQIEVDQFKVYLNFILSVVILHLIALQETATYFLPSDSICYLFVNIL